MTDKVLIICPDCLKAKKTKRIESDPLETKYISLSCNNCSMGGFPDEITYMEIMIQMICCNFFPLCQCYTQPVVSQTNNGEGNNGV